MARRNPNSNSNVTYKKKRVTVNETEEMVCNNYERGPKQQKQGYGKLIDVFPKTEPQRQMLEAWSEPDSQKNLMCIGSAGSGKSFFALWLALRDLERGLIKKIIIVRSLIACRSSVGALPGNIQEKGAPYEYLYINMVNSLMGCGTAYESLKKKGLIVFETTSFLRGMTFDDTVVIFDECQNADFLEAQTVITRLGINSRIIMCGDTKQSDMERNREKSGISQIAEIAKRIPKWFEVITFLPQDIVRSGFVKAWILAQE